MQFLESELSVPLSFRDLEEYAEKIKGQENRKRFYDILWRDGVRDHEHAYYLLPAMFSAPSLRPTEQDIARMMRSGNKRLWHAARSFCLGHWPELRLPQEEYLRMIQSRRFADVYEGLSCLTPYFGSPLHMARKEELYLAVEGKMREVEAMWERGELLDGLERHEQMLGVVSYPICIMVSNRRGGMEAFVKTKADELIRHAIWLEVQAQKQLSEYGLKSARSYRARLEEIRESK